MEIDEAHQKLHRYQCTHAQKK